MGEQPSRAVCHHVEVGFMKQISTSALVLLLAAMVMPVNAQNREHQQMTADVRMLQEQTQQLAITLAAINQALTESIKALNARLDQANEATRKGFADQKLTIDNIVEGVQVIRERSSDTNVRIGSLSEELEAMRLTVQALQALQQSAAAPPVPADPNAPVDPGAPPSPAPLPPAASLPSTAGLSPTRMFDTARADYFAGQWASAINGFEAFLRTFPRSEQADDAQLNIGESYYAQRQWPEAIAAYNLVIQNYPGTNSVPTAYYKRGLAQEGAGQLDAARASWETVAKSFPDSDEGRLAKQAVARVSKTP
jgi:tol-pal system protein YbgF